MAIVLAITNSKGGVGKTTTCANLGAALAASGKRILLVDNDPQGDLTKVMRADPKSLKYTLANLMNSVLDDSELELFAEKAVIQREGIHYIPANSKLAAVSSRLVALQMSSRYRGGDGGGTPCELVMANVLKYYQDRYDYILIDCGHSMDLLTINALAAADQAIVPVQAHYLAMEDISTTVSPPTAPQSRPSQPAPITPGSTTRSPTRPTTTTIGCLLPTCSAPTTMPLTSLRFR